MNKSTKKQTSKRKSTSALEDTRSAKQPKLTIDSFFTPKVTVQVGSGIDGVAGGIEEKVFDVVLSDEQMRVLRMVVEEGKNVFFTGSAGTLEHIFSLFWGMLTACRYRKVIAFEGNYCGTQKEVRKEVWGLLGYC
jgi:hypothetical protein